MHEDAFLLGHLKQDLVKGQIHDRQIQDWPEPTSFLGYDEVWAVKLSSTWLEGHFLLHPWPAGPQSLHAVPGHLHLIAHKSKLCIFSFNCN